VLKASGNNGEGRQTNEFLEFDQKFWIHSIVF